MTASDNTLKSKIACFLFVIFCIVFISPSKTVEIRPTIAPITYAVASTGQIEGNAGLLAGTHNPEKLAKLIQCESDWVNISRPDSNNRISDGLLQFNRGASNILGSGTWADMEQRFKFYGSPIIPSDAIRMADMMIDAGFISRWTCAKMLGLDK